MTQWPLRYLVNTDPLSLYKEADMSYFRSASNLHVSLRVKISYFQKPLHLFKVEKFTLSFPGQDHSTFVNNLPEYVAINDYDNEYITFQQQPMLLKDRFYFLDNQQHKVLSKQYPTCLTALFHNQPRNYKTL
jgi:hypothetical protein